MVQHVYRKKDVSRAGEIEVAVAPYYGEHAEHVAHKMEQSIFLLCDYITKNVTISKYNIYPLRNNEIEGPLSDRYFEMYETFVALVLAMIREAET